MALSPETMAMIENTAEMVRAEIQKAGDLLAVAAMAQEAIVLTDHYRERFDLQRTAAFRAAAQAGYTFSDLSRATGLSRQRVAQLAELPPAAPGRRPVDHVAEAEVRRRLRDGDGI